MRAVVFFTLLLLICCVPTVAAPGDGLPWSWENDRAVNVSLRMPAAWTAAGQQLRGRVLTLREMRAMPEQQGETWHDGAAWLWAAYRFDAEGRVTNIDPGGGTVPVSVSYDPQGRVLVMTQGREKIKCFYAPAGHLQTVVTNTNNQLAQTLRLTVNAQGQVTKALTTGAHGDTVQTEIFSYDAQGRFVSDVQQWIRPKSATAPAQIATSTTTMRYAAASATADMVYEDSDLKRRVIVTLDAQQRVTERLQYRGKGDGVLIRKETFAFSASEAVQQIFVKADRSPALPLVRTAHYALDGRLLSAVCLFGATRELQRRTCSYDERLNLIEDTTTGSDVQALLDDGTLPADMEEECYFALMESQTELGTTAYTYAYDAQGNWTRRTEWRVTGDTRVPREITTRTLTYAP